MDTNLALPHPLTRQVSRCPGRVCLGLGVALALGTAVIGCNTMEGAGKDIQSVGKSVEDAAEDADDD